jgi:hypothetical protein
MKFIRDAKNNIYVGLDNLANESLKYDYSVHLLTVVFQKVFTPTLALHQHYGILE